jgi:superfamily II DNA or RNA helicase
MSYQDFLASKLREAPEIGIKIDTTDVNPMLHEWQQEIVTWAVRTGRAAVWATTGLGKSFMQIEWARLSGDTALIVAPLVVCTQTVREAAKLDITARYVRSANEITGPGMYVTNYEMVQHFPPHLFDAVVLDEASILKNSAGSMRTMLIEHFRPVPRRLACTATPAPNDSEELTNQAEFLGVISRVEMLAAYFVHDSDAGWRLKGHARGPMFKWMATWAVAINQPADMDYPNGEYDLPGLLIKEHLLDVDVVPEGELFATEIGGVGGRAQVRRATLDARVEKAGELINSELAEPWVVWCGLNDEQDALAKLFGDRCISLTGSQSPEQKVELLYRWLDGDRPILLTKPTIAGQGINMQHCARMVFVGLNDSYEQYFQAIRRCHRYGQKRVVHAHIVLSALEGQIAANVRRKEREATETMAELVTAIRTAKELEAVPA